ARAERGAAGASGRSPQEAGAERPASGASRPAASPSPPRGKPAARPPEAGPGKEAAAQSLPQPEEERSAAMDRLLAARKRNSR
ncbi:hypothetical protein ACTHSJ_32145, partial [Paenibacillus cellulositrophicus]|uniref:hypothetical protein n=1 Tax=Paenibacillus cellulositrophicus TaxID=562959 RepID=UPI003F7D97D5